MPPLSSKNRSAIMVFWVGTAPSTARPATIYSTACSAPASSSPHSSCSHFTAAVTSGELPAASPGETFGIRALIFSRSSATCWESSGVRAGASPRQNGTLGGAPWASSTSTLPDCTRRIRQEVLPRRMMSPLKLSTAKSSSTVPTTVPSGCAITVYSALSGIAPPLVMAARRLPRRACRRPFTRSRCRYAP